jgi:hypothetical protein
MKTTKIGERLVRTLRGTLNEPYRKIGYTFTVCGLGWGGDPIDEDGRHHFVESCELAWTPEVGEMIEVKNNPTVWYKREYRGMVDGYYITKPYTGDHSLRPWKEGRPIKPDTTITFADGTTVELSEESYKAMRGES